MPSIPVSVQDKIQCPAEDVQQYIAILKANRIYERVEKVCVNPANLQETAGTLSNSYCVTVIFENNNREPLHLFVKSSHVIPSLAEALKALKAFEKEATFYTEYLPAALELCKSKGKTDLLNIYSKCYCGNEDMIVLENLVESQGYQVEDRQLMYDLGTTRVVLTTLAQHHAISYAMFKKYGGAKLFFETFSNLDYDAIREPILKIMMGPTMEHGLSRNIQIVQETNPEEEIFLEKVTPCIGQSFDMHLRSLDDDFEDDSLLVLSHGDFTVNNILVLRNKSQHPIAVKHVDFQLTRYHCAALEVAKFLFTSVKSEVRQENLRDILTLYLHTFKDTVNKLGCDITLSDEEFYTMYRKKSSHGFWFAQCMGSGPIFSVMKDINVYSLGDPSNWDELYRILLQEWIGKHPKKAKEISKHVIGLFKEFEQLNGNKLY